MALVLLMAAAVNSGMGFLGIAILSLGSRVAQESSIPTLAGYKKPACGGAGRRAKRLQSPGRHTQNSKTDVVGAAVGEVVVPIGAATIPGSVGPRTAAKYTTVIPSSDPGRAISGGTMVVVVPAIHAPLKDIAVDIVEAKSVRGKAAYFSGVVTVVVDQIRSDGLAKMKGRGGTGPTGVLPLSFAG